jgi:hypothetical protein
MYTYIEKVDSKRRGDPQLLFEGVGCVLEAAWE